MTGLIVGVIVFMLVLGFWVYKIFFKRILYIRKRILLFSSQLLKADSLQEQIAVAKSAGKYDQQLTLSQEAIQSIDEQLEILDPIVLSFLGHVTPVHKNYYLIAQSFRASVKDMYETHEEMLDISKMKEAYINALKVLHKMQLDGQCSLGPEFEWWRPEQAPDCDISHLALAQWLEDPQANEGEYAEILEKVALVNDDSLPPFKPLDPKSGFVLFYVLHNKSININIAMRACLQQINLKQHQDVEAEFEHDLDYYVQTLIELVAMQRLVWWSIGWLDLMPTKAEVALDSQRQQSSPSGILDREFIA